MTRNKIRAYIKANIESVTTTYFSDRRVRDMVRNASGIVGDGFIGVPMPDEERRAILNSLFRPHQW